MEIGNSLKDRLKRIAEKEGLSIKAFEEICGLGRGNINNMSLDSTLGANKLAKIMETFPDVDLYWLVTGRGEAPEVPVAPAPNLEVETASPHQPTDVANAANVDLFLTLLRERDAVIREDNALIREQAEEIGRLRERIAQMQQRFEKDAAGANTDSIACVG